MKKVKMFVFTTLISLMPVLHLYAQANALSKPLNAIIANYLAVKNALSRENGDDAAAKAKLLLASVNDLTRAGLTTEQITLAGKLEYDSRHISEVNRVAHQREHFASLSNNLFIIIKELKLNKIPLYRQYCTMNKQYFITENEKAKDPFMGMSLCSKTVEVLKPQ